MNLKKDDDFGELANWINGDTKPNEGEAILDNNDDDDDGAPLEGDIFDAAEADFTNKQDKADAMAIALQWQEDGEFTYDALESLAYGVSADHDLDDEGGDSSESSEAHYNALMEHAGEALIELGASEKNVKSLIDDEDDEAGKALGDRLSSVMDGLEEDDSTLINRFAVGGMVFDAKVKVWDGKKGKFVLKNKKKRRKRKQSPKQRASLKRNRMKAHTAKAKKKRGKARKMRKSRGI